MTKRQRTAVVLAALGLVLIAVAILVKSTCTEALEVLPAGWSYGGYSQINMGRTCSSIAGAVFDNGPDQAISAHWRSISTLPMILLGLVIGAVGCIRHRASLLAAASGLTALGGLFAFGFPYVYLSWMVSAKQIGITQAWYPYVLIFLGAAMLEVAARQHIHHLRHRHTHPPQ